MKSLFFVTIICLVQVGFAQLPGSTTKPYIKADVTKTQFGATIDTTKKALSVDEAIAQFQTQSAEKKTGPVLLEAKIDKVCKKKGCWMTIKSKSRDMRVIFKDYGFFVPMNLVGRTIYAEGTLKEEKLTLEETKHFIKDEGGDPSKVTVPIIDYQFVASGVVVKK
jgi:hypothetical protein